MRLSPRSDPQRHDAEVVTVASMAEKRELTRFLQTIARVLGRSNPSDRLAAREPIVGHWVSRGKKVVGDADCHFVQRVIADRLKRVAAHRQAGRWQVLYLDPVLDGYWELTYLEGAGHGGGPPSLVPIDEPEAFRVYGRLAPADR